MLGRLGLMEPVIAGAEPSGIDGRRVLAVGTQPWPAVGNGLLVPPRRAGCACAAAGGRAAAAAPVARRAGAPPAPKAQLIIGCGCTHGRCASRLERCCPAKDQCQAVLTGPPGGSQTGGLCLAVPGALGTLIPVFLPGRAGAGLHTASWLSQLCQGRWHSSSLSPTMAARLQAVTCLSGAHCGGGQPHTLGQGPQA